MVAPLCLAVAKKRRGMRMASIVASGTWTPSLMAGLTFGSRASTSVWVSRRTGMPHS